MKMTINETLKVWGKDSPAFKQKCDELKKEIGHFQFIKIYNTIIK